MKINIIIGDKMKIKNVENKLKIELFKYGTDKALIFVKTKEMFMFLFDRWIFNNVNMTIDRSYSGKNEWIIRINDLKEITDKKGFSESILEYFKRIGATVIDKR
jgi:hypothetical protein